MKKPNYYGRWQESTGLYTAPDGKKYKMTFEQYIALIEELRGPYAAHTIRRKKMQRKANKAQETQDAHDQIVDTYMEVARRQFEKTGTFDPTIKDEMDKALANLPKRKETALDRIKRLNEKNES